MHGEGALIPHLHLCIPSSERSAQPPQHQERSAGLLCRQRHPSALSSVLTAPPAAGTGGSWAGLQSCCVTALCGGETSTGR